MFFPTDNKNSHVLVNGVNPFFQSSTNVIFLLHLGEYLQPGILCACFWEDTA